MLEGKYYAALDTVFPFFVVFLDRLIGCGDKQGMKTVARRTKTLLISYYTKNPKETITTFL